MTLQDLMAIICFILSTMYIPPQIIPRGNKKMKAYLKSVIFSGLLLLAITGYAQKGTGESEGVSRQGLNPAVIELNGTVKQVEVGPCKYTTGKSVSGTHLIVETNKGETLNIHLGPTKEVSKFTNDIQGHEIEVMGFRTDKLPEGHYIAKEMTDDGNKTVLRDETLKPFWSGKSGRDNWRQKRRAYN